MMSRSVRTVVRALGWTLTLALALAVNVFITVEHYVGLRVGIDLTNLDRQPIATMSLVGPLVGPLFGDATLNDFLAATFALATALFSFLFFHAGSRVVRLLGDLRIHRARGDDDSVAEARAQIWVRLGKMVVLAIPIAMMAALDVQYFRYRALAGLYGIENPAEAAQSIPTWSQPGEGVAQLFTWTLALLGGWTYAAVTIGVCFAFEQIKEYAGTEWSTLLGQGDDLVDWLRGDNEDPVLHGYNLDGTPTFDHEREVDFDPEGGPIRPEMAEEPDGPSADRVETPRAQLHVQAPAANLGASRGQAHDIPSADVLLHGGDDVDAASDENNQPAGGASGEGGRRPRAPEVATGFHDVIGGELGERVSLAQATSDDRYFVDPETHGIWLAQYRRSLMNGTNPPAAADGGEGEAQ